MTDAQLGKWLAAFRVGALKPILERFEPGDVIDALVALLRDVLRLSRIMKPGFTAIFQA